MPDMFLQNLDAAGILHPVAIKKPATAAEIRAELRQRIERLAAREPKFRGCAAPVPKALHVDRDGAPNWTIDGFPNLQPGCFTALVKIVDQARLEYELAEPAASA
jgi:hypothetical protein